MSFESKITASDNYNSEKILGLNIIWNINCNGLNVTHKFFTRLRQKFFIQYMISDQVQ